MNYGMYISSSGMLTNMARLNVASNNLANINTDGFKADLIAVRQRAVVREEDNLFHMDSNAMLERLGAGVMPTQTMVQLTQGAIRVTDNPLDLAIEGQGVLEVSPGAGDGEARYTRDGRLTISERGELVLASNGRAVMQRNGGAIKVHPALPVDIRSDGAVVQNGGVVGRLNFVHLPGGVVKEGDNLLKAAGVGDTERAAGLIKQGAVVESGVNAITAMMDVTAAGKAAQANARMIRYFDQTMSQAISSLGRVN